MKAPIQAGIFLFTGDRDWRNYPILAARLTNIHTESRGRAVVITGGARGLDIMAWEIARNVGLRNIRVDAPWDAFGKRAGAMRNAWMLEFALALVATYGPITVLAFHNNIAESRGTADMVARCKKVGLAPLLITENDVQGALA